MLFDVLATVVVVAGIFGEAGATGKVSSINSELRSKTSLLRAKSDQLLALVTQEAGSAASSAERANAAAGKAQNTVDGVGKKAKVIEWEVDQAQYFLSAREIRDPDGLKKKFAQFKGKTIFFRSYVNDGDGYFICKELLWSAASAGIIPNDQCGLYPVEPPYPNTGINVFAPTLDEMLALNTTLAGATMYGSGG
jgi:hypothetical protein